MDTFPASISQRPFLWVTVLATLVRIVLILYGEWQDRNLQVKYTDVDYWVFTDAAEAIIVGKSPFFRATYRYSPLLALLMIPNVLHSPLWGKAVFCACDLMAGYFIYSFLKERTSKMRACKLTAVFWLLNPMVFTISTRGNAESILSVWVLGSLFYLSQREILSGSLLFGLAVHMKLFPIIYVVPILKFLWHSQQKTGTSVEGSKPSRPSTPKKPQSPLVLGPSSESISNSESPDDTKTRMRRRKRNIVTPVTTPRRASRRRKSMLLMTQGLRDILIFALASGGMFLLVTGFYYRLYGKEYLEQGFLYHLTRKDHRHNFSPYFYLFYTEAAQALPRFVEYLAFFPQLVVLTYAGIKFGAKDLPFACFIMTFVFVTFNKVVTSQYFVWYLTLFPMAYLSLHNISTLRWTVMSGLWFCAQTGWLHFAYKLEFLGQDVFVHVWAASIVFLLVNTWIAGQFIRHRGGPDVIHPAPGIITVSET